MKSKSTQGLLVALGAALITSLLYSLAARLPESVDHVFVLFSFIQLAPVAVVLLALLKFYVYEKISFLTLIPIRQSRFPRGRDEKQF